MSASKENQLKNLLSISGASPAKSPAVTPLPTPSLVAAAATASTTSPGVVKSAAEERTVNLLSSLSVVKRSPELRPLNSNTAASTAVTVKSASPSTVGAATGNKSAAVKPLLLSPSDLAKLAVA